MKFLRLIIIISSVGLVTECSGQKREGKTADQYSASINLDSLPVLKKIVRGIEKGKRVDESTIGYEGNVSSQWEKYEKLKNVANTQQLIALTDHKSAAVRCYAFQALAERHSDKTFAILLKHLNDTAFVRTQSGCIVTHSLVGDYFYILARPSQDERKTLDRILIYDKSIKLSAKDMALISAEPTTANYERIRQLAKEERNPYALVTLGKYQKQTDKELIASFFKDDDTQLLAMYAVREFPDAYFYSFVVKVFEQEWKKELCDHGKWRICYQALAKYPTSETLELFNRTISSKDTQRYQSLCQYILTAITKYPNELFEPLKSEIKLERFYMNQFNDDLKNLD